MMKCLCCNKEIKDPGEYEKNIRWHRKCIRKFFGTDMLPDIDLSEKELERLANSAVSKGLTVPGVTFAPPLYSKAMF
jgi:serine/threonine-protein kinase HipA